GGARLGAPAVLPAHQRRERHEDRLGAVARLEAEERAAVVEEVELDVAPAPVELELSLALAVWGVSAAFDDRQVGGKEGIADAAQQLEAALEAAIPQVVEEEAADPPRLAA